MPNAACLLAVNLGDTAFAGKRPLRRPRLFWASLWRANMDSPNTACLAPCNAPPTNWFSTHTLPRCAPSLPDAVRCKPPAPRAGSNAGLPASGAVGTGGYGAGKVKIDANFTTRIANKLLERALEGWLDFEIGYLQHHARIGRPQIGSPSLIPRKNPQAIGAAQSGDG